MRNQRVVVSGFILQKDKFLLVKRSEDDSFLPGYWELPGGKTDYGEDPGKSIAREVKEECGLDIDVSYPLHVVTFSADLDKDGEEQFIEIFYLCKMLDYSQSIQLSHEHSAYKWVTFEEAKKDYVTEFTRGILDKLQQHPLLSSFL